MKIKDNGVGFSQDALLNNDVYGVRGMEERAKMVDGEFSVETSPNQSTQIMLSLEVNHG
jgi:signal transduction histidine kinase